MCNVEFTTPSMSGDFSIPIEPCFQKNDQNFEGDGDNQKVNKRIDM